MANEFIYEYMNILDGVVHCRAASLFLGRAVNCQLSIVSSFFTLPWLLRRRSKGQRRIKKKVSFFLLLILTNLPQFSGLTSSRRFWEDSKSFSVPARMVHMSGL